MDRLNELKRGAAKPDDISVNISDNQGSNSPMHGSSVIDTGKKSNLDEFLSDIEIIQKNIHVIAEAAKKIEEINQRMLLATTSDREAVESQQLNEIIKVTNKKAAVTKRLLQAMRDSNDNVKRGGTNPYAAEIKVKENHLNTLTRKFVEVMKDYQLIQSKYKADLKGKVRRQVQIVKPDATNEEIEEVMKTGSSNLIKDAILEGAADSIINATQNVKEKYKDVLALEESVQQLHQMFLDFAVLTEQQSELLDQIEYQVKEASDYIDKGNSELTKAIELTISLRKKQCCCLTLVVIAVAVLIGIILASIASKNGGSL